MKSLTLLLLCFCTVQSNGQSVKIENITIDAEVAQRYFLDCYMRPDTIKLKRMWENKKYLFAFSSQDEQYERSRVESFNAKILSLAIRQVIDTVYYAAHKDTVYNDQSFFWTISDTKETIKKKKDKIRASGIKAIEDIASHVEIVNTGKYIVPRSASTIDFIKWYSSQIIKQP